MEKDEDFERSLYVKDYDLKSSVGGSLTGSEIGGQRVIRLTTGCIVFLLTVAVVHLMPTSFYTVSSSSGAGCSQGLGSHWSLCWVRMGMQEIKSLHLCPSLLLLRSEITLISG